MFNLSLRDGIEFLNLCGTEFCRFAAAMLAQFSLLVILFLCLDQLWFKRKSSAFRYSVWSLLLIKLMLPVWLQGPISLTGLLDGLPQAKRASALKPTVQLDTIPSRDEFHANWSSVSGPTSVNQSIDSEEQFDEVTSTPSTAPVIRDTALPKTVVMKPIPALSLEAVLLLSWMGCVIVLSSLFTRRIFAVRALTQAAIPATDELHSILLECQSRLRLERRSVRIGISDSLSTPAICGFWRPTILLPKSLVQLLDAEQLRLVLIHELMHWKRFDLQVNCLQTILAILYFYNPLVWFTNWFLRRIREEAVDEAVVSTMRASAQRYSATLLDIVALSRPSPEYALRMIGVVESRKALSQRIRRILMCPATRRTQLGRSGLALLICIAVLVLPLAGRRVQSMAQESVKSSEKSPKKAAIPQDRTEAVSNPIEKNGVVVETDDVARDELAGVVLDVDGKPIPGVTVDAWTWYPGNETTTDKDGRFRLKGFDPKRNVEVLVKKENYSPQHFAQRPPGVKGWVVTLGQKTYFEGVVFGSDEKPVAGAVIHARFGPVRADGVTIGDILTEVKTDNEGRYRMYVMPETYDIQISAGTRGVYRQSGVLIKPDEAKMFRVLLQPGVRFEAQVVDSVTGEPVEGFVLWQWRPPKLFGKSDADGWIVFEGLIPGDIQFNCGGGDEIVHPSGMRFYQHGPFGRWWSPDSTNEWMRFQIDDKRTNWQRNFDDLAFKLTENMDPVRIVVEQGVAVRGRVTDPDGNPVEGATVAPARTGSGNSLTGDTRYSVKTNADGAYHVVLPASNKSKYNLIVHDGEYQQWRKWANGVTEPMQTTPGQKIEGLNLQLTKPATIRGRVLVGGAPGRDREVRTHDFEKRENRYYDPTTKTDAEGNFELKFVRPGKHFLQVEPFWLSAEEAPDASTKIIEVKPGEILEGIELMGQAMQRDVAPETAALPFKARVLDHDRKPVAKALVGLGLNGGLKEYFGQVPGLPKDTDTKSDRRGTVPLPEVSMMGRMRLNETLIYAVDQERKRAGIALLDLQQFLNATAKNPPQIDVVLESAVHVTVHLDTQAFREIREKPTLTQLMLFKGENAFQRSIFKGIDTMEYILPPGDYRVAANSPPISEAATVEFQVKPGQERLEVEIPLQPSRMARLMGNPAPEFEQVRRMGSGKIPKLSELKGKVVVLDFWGHWCGPCVHSMPKLMALYDEFHDKGVEFIALHDDSVDSPEELQPILDGLKDQHWNGRAIPFTVLLDGGGETKIPGSDVTVRGVTTANYGISAFPTTMIIGRDGRIDSLIDADQDAVKERLNALLNAK